MSHFLAEYLGDVRHPVRARVLGSGKSPNFPRAREVERVPDLDVAGFWGVVNATPDHVRAAYVVIVALGLRVGEYARLAETDLLPLTRQVRIPGLKTAASAAVTSVDAQLWPWVKAGIPAPVQYGWLRKYWKRGLKATGLDAGLRLHDLRHLTAQVLTRAGLPRVAIREFMRHGSGSITDMTDRYARQDYRRECAEVLAAALVGGQVPLSVPQSPRALESGRG